MKIPKHLYRLALFGRSDAGKTCILTALSMPHKAHPLGHSVAWVPDPPEADTDDKDVAQAYREGKAALNKARAAMEAGDKPAPNPLRILRYRFDFTTIRPYPRKYQVELLDYSGELIDPRMNAEGLAKKLRDLLGNMDGVFVLAEAPRPGAERNRLPREFELLQQAFALLAAEKERSGAAARTPVVLMLNKWDRRHPTPASPAQRAAEMDEFLHGDPEPPHLALSNFLEGAVAENCFNAIPVSAFGTARVETLTDQEGVSRQVELPPLDLPLPSFGLEDGFVWAARVRDEQELAALERTAARTGVASLIPWFGLNAFNPWGAAAVRREGNRLAERFPESSDMHKRARAGAAKGLRVGAVRSLLLVAMLAAGLFGGEATLDIARYRRAEADFARTDLEFADMERHQKFLLAYATSPAYRHFGSRLLVGREDARGLHQKMYDRHEQLLQKKIEGLDGDVLAQEPYVDEYGRLFPSGPFMPKVAEVKQRAETKRCVAKNQKHLGDADAKVIELAARPLLRREDVDALNRQIADVPDVAHQTDEQKQALAALRGKSLALGQKVDRLEGEKGIQDAIDVGDFAKAGERLKAAESWENGIDTRAHAAAAMQKAEDMIRAELLKKDWAKAVDLGGKMRVGFSDRALLNGDQIRKVEELIDAAYRGQHRDLYAEVVRNPTAEGCRVYLQSAKVGGTYKTRRKQVEELLRYYEDMGKPRPLTIGIESLYMGGRDTFWKDSFELYATLDGSTLGESKKNGWPASQTHAVGFATPLTLTPTATASVYVRLRNDGLAKTHDDMGVETFNVTVAEMNGKTLTLPVTKFYVKKSDPSKVKLTVSGLPVRPTLPASAD